MTTADARRQLPDATLARYEAAMAVHPHQNGKVTAAFVLAAGLGTRMRPLTDHVPKPLVPLAGRPLLDHVLDRIADARLGDVIVNVHYKAEQIETHLAARAAIRPSPRIRISDERDLLLDTGGGALQALPLLGDAPFLIANSDTVWLENDVANIAALIDFFDPVQMDALLLLADRETSLGYAGRGDFNLVFDCLLQRPATGQTVPFVFAGISIASPRLFRDMPASWPFSLNAVWDRAMSQGRLFGLPLRGTWMHVGDPQALADAERLIARAARS